MSNQTLPTNGTATSYGKPYTFKGRWYVDERHTVTRDGRVVDAYKYANIPFKNERAATAFVESKR